MIGFRRIRPSLANRLFFRQIWHLAVADIICECHGIQHYADALGVNLRVPLVVHLGTLHFDCLLRDRDCLQFLVLGIASPFYGPSQLLS